MSCCGTTLQFKRGGTFHAHVQYIPEAGHAANLQGATVTSHLRRLSGQLVAAMDGVVAPDGMSFELHVDEDATALWPVATLVWDMRVELGVDVVYTETLQLQVLPAVTHEDPVARVLPLLTPTMEAVEVLS